MAPELRTKVTDKNFKNHLAITFLHVGLLGTWTTSWTEAPGSDMSVSVSALNQNEGYSISMK